MDKNLKLVFNYRNGNIGAHHVTHLAADTVFGVFHLSGKISFLTDGFRFAQTFLRARINTQIACFAFINIYFYSWHNSPNRQRGQTRCLTVKYISFSRRNAIICLHYSPTDGSFLLQYC